MVPLPDDPPEALHGVLERGPSLTADLATERAQERYRGERRGCQVLGTLEATAVEMKSVGRELALTAADIKAGRRLAYADALAAVLAMPEEAVLVTGDPGFRQLEGVPSFKWLPEAEWGHS